jgi:hypothetical protein
VQPPSPDAIRAERKAADDAKLRRAYAGRAQTYAPQYVVAGAALGGVPLPPQAIPGLGGNQAAADALARSIVADAQRTQAVQQAGAAHKAASEKLARAQDAVRAIKAPGGVEEMAHPELRTKYNDALLEAKRLEQDAQVEVDAAVGAYYRALQPAVQGPGEQAPPSGAPSGPQAAQSPAGAAGAAGGGRPAAVQRWLDMDDASLTSNLQAGARAGKSVAGIPAADLASLPPDEVRARLRAAASR